MLWINNLLLPAILDIMANADFDDENFVDLMMLYAIETQNYDLLNFILDMVLVQQEGPPLVANHPPGGEPQQDDWLLMEWGGPYPDEDVVMNQ